VEQVRFEEQDLLLIDIPEGQDKPYVVEGAIYFRRGGRTVHANRDEIGQLIYQRGHRGQRWERQLSMGADREDLDEHLVLETLRLAVQSQRWQGAPDDRTGFLTSLGLIERGGVTNAAVLLYGKTPSRTLPQARVRLLVMPEGKTGNRYQVDRLFERCLLQTAMELPGALTLHVGGVESRFSKDWQRSDRPIYPMTALREGIMNALVHRDYALSGSTVVAVSQDELQISNPGGLPNELKPSDLKKRHPSLPRNPDVAHVCFLHGLIEKVGRGTQRIVEDCREAELPEPKWQSSSFETTLTLYSPHAGAGNAERELGSGPF
jgi:ATP-dependent DNA helicase RecG